MADPAPVAVEESTEARDFAALSKSKRGSKARLTSGFFYFRVRFSWYGDRDCSARLKIGVVPSDFSISETESSDKLCKYFPLPKGESEIDSRPALHLVCSRVFVQVVVEAWHVLT